MAVGLNKDLEVDPRILSSSIGSEETELLGAAAYSYYLCYKGGKHWENSGLRLAQAKR
jgi:hypothetical protein